MRKIFEKRFRSSSEAVDYANSAGWDYKGKRGFFRKYDCYSGVSIVRRSADPESRSDVHTYQLRIYPDGYASLLINRDSGIGGTSGLPNFVWTSADSYSFAQFMKKEVNDFLFDNEAGIRVGAVRHPKCFELRSDDGQEVGEVAFPTAALSHPTNRAQLSSQEVDAFVNQKHAEYNRTMGHNVRFAERT